MNLVSKQHPLTKAEKLNSSKVAPDTTVSPLSVFSDQIWLMEALVKLPGVSEWSKKWDFGRVPGFPSGFALSLAEYAYARLYRPVATHQREGEWLTVLNELSALNNFALYCESQGLNSFNEVDSALYEQFLKSMQFSNQENNDEVKKSDERIKKIIGFIYRFWEYKSVISSPLPSKPFGMPFEKLFNKGGSNVFENATPVIPEPIYAAIMAAALDYVLIYSSTIITIWIEFSEQWNTEFSHLGLSNTTNARRMKKIFLNLSTKHKAYWRAKDWASYGDIYKELQQLRSACNIVILAFSGIRVSELLSLEAGCSVSNEYKEGHWRHYINTTLHKHKGNGSRDSWVVIDEVVQAITILEMLTKKARTESEDNRLMLTDGSNSFFSVTRSYIGVKMSEFTTEAISLQIQVFQNNCNNKLNRPKIPDWTNENGLIQPWEFNTRQFRRTLARHIARQPFGIIAGMIQYKHVQVTIFEGYAGSDPEWNKMLDDEKTLASIDLLSEVAMDLSNGQLAGDFGIKLKEELEVARQN